MKSELDGQAPLLHPYISPLTQFIFQLEKQHGSDYVTSKEDLTDLTKRVIDYGVLHCNTNYCLTNSRDHVAQRAMIALTKAMAKEPSSSNTSEMLRYESCIVAFNAWRTLQSLEPVVRLSYLHLLNPRLLNEMTLNCEPIEKVLLEEMIFSDNGYYAWHINDLQAAIVSTGRLTNPYTANVFFSDHEMLRIFTKDPNLAADYKIVIQSQILPARANIQDQTIQQLLTLIANIEKPSPSNNQTLESLQQQFHINLHNLLNTLPATEKQAINDLKISVADHNKSLLDYRNNPETCSPEMINNFYLTLKNFTRATNAISIIRGVEEHQASIGSGYQAATLHS